MYIRIYSSLNEYLLANQCLSPLQFEGVSPSQSVPLSLSFAFSLSTDKLDIYEDLRMQFLSWMHVEAGELCGVGRPKGPGKGGAL